MNQTIDPCNIFIKDMDITVRAKNVLTALGVETVHDLHVMQALDTIPPINTMVKYYPFIRVSLVYSSKVHNEVLDILKEYPQTSIY